MAQSQNSTGFNTLQEKLEKIRHITKTTNFKTQNKFNLPPVDRIGNDGTDHINIWERAGTDLGVALSHMADLPFTHETYGKFRSIEGFWHYIRSVTRDDRTRMMAGYKAKKFGDSLQPQRIDDFKAIIMDANWQKVKQYAPLLEELKKSTLPFDVYYLFNNDATVRIRPASAFWLIEGFEEMRTALKEGREPDFNFLRDKPNTARKVEDKPKQKHVSAGLSPALVSIANARNEANKKKPEPVKTEVDTPVEGQASENTAVDSN